MNELERIAELERRADRSERILRIIGEKMEEFDFDSLLSEVEDVKKDEKLKENAIEDLDDLLNTEEPEDEVVEDNTIDELDDLLDELPETPEVSEPLEVVAPAEPIVEETYESTGVEFAEETKAYAKAILDIEREKQALAAKAKLLKEDYRDQGVDISSVNKAMKEIVKELKESAEEAASIERVKEMFKKDDGIYTDLVGLTE